jgi:hypothetical protein
MLNGPITNQSAVNENKNYENKMFKKKIQI